MTKELSIREFKEDRNLLNYRNTVNSLLRSTASYMLNKHLAPMFHSHIAINPRTILLHGESTSTYLNSKHMTAIRDGIIRSIFRHPPNGYWIAKLECSSIKFDEVDPHLHILVGYPSTPDEISKDSLMKVIDDLVTENLAPPFLLKTIKIEVTKVKNSEEDQDEALSYVMKFESDTFGKNQINQNENTHWMGQTGFLYECSKKVMKMMKNTEKQRPF